MSLLLDTGLRVASVSNFQKDGCHPGQRIKSEWASLCSVFPIRPLLSKQLLHTCPINQLVDLTSTNCNWKNTSFFASQICQTMITNFIPFQGRNLFKGLVSIILTTSRSSTITKSILVEINRGQISLDT